jgi:uncharacterized protein YceH (UPF0502 family)
LRDVPQVEAVLESLMAREEPFVTRLPREPGKRDSRYAHLFCGDIPHAVNEFAAEGSRRTAPPAHSSVEQLTARVDELALELAELKERLAALVPGFDDTP